MDWQRKTALIWVSLLLESGAAMDLIDQEGSTALHRAATNGHTEVVRLLLAPAPPAAPSLAPAAPQSECADVFARLLCPGGLVDAVAAP
ncbi:Ankyrin repeat domain-containing protein 39 [Symbiodinium microadriaticum]|uniref:Ankyrin repeat domain-containing protein 39 n=1 Tax=Symbiodinium microadriaticum TaxID=2951 RepID=A0A1Q9BWI3_SYMMI|nr:Ankyrin repeat domain-containing protein 39 [Symbiodinium microadriaticum]